jgi:TetR/AcrR family transcriptional repressor of uid operon
MAGHTPFGHGQSVRSLAVIGPSPEPGQPPAEQPGAGETPHRAEQPGAGETAHPAEVSTRNRLLDAAAVVFCEKGYDGTTVAEVARKAGLTTGAIYANFRDKGELLLKTIERGSAEAVADLEAARKAGVSAANRLLLMARRMVVDPDPTQRLLLVEMFSAARRDPDVAERVSATLTAMEGEVARLIERAKHDGDVGEEWDTEAIARFCVALGVGYAQLRTAGLDDPDLAAWAALTAQLVSSVRPKS